MLRTSDKKLVLGSELGDAFNAAVDWDRITPPVTDYDVWFDSSYVYSVLDSAGAVTHWEDRKKTGHRMEQGTAGNRPLVNNRVLGSFSPIDYISNDRLDSVSYNVSARPHSAIAAIVADSLTGSRTVYCGLGGNNRIGLIITTSGQVQTNLRNIVNITSTATISATVPAIVGHALSTTGVRQFINGTQETQADSNSATAGFIRTGLFSDDLSAPMDGAIGELLLWSRELSSDELTALYDYLRAKWRV